MPASIAFIVPPQSSLQYNYMLKTTLLYLPTFYFPLLFMRALHSLTSNHMVVPTPNTDTSVVRTIEHCLIDNQDYDTEVIFLKPIAFFELGGIRTSRCAEVPGSRVRSIDVVIEPEAQPDTGDTTPRSV